MRFHYSFLETSTTTQKKLLGHDYREGSFKEKLQQREKGGQVSRRQFWPFMNSKTGIFLWTYEQ